MTFFVNIWSEPTVLAWGQAGPGKWYGITDASLHNFGCRDFFADLRPLTSDPRIVVISIKCQLRLFLTVDPEPLTVIKFFKP